MQGALIDVPSALAEIREMMAMAPDADLHPHQISDLPRSVSVASAGRGRGKGGRSVQAVNTAAS